MIVIVVPLLFLLRLVFVLFYCRCGCGCACGCGGWFTLLLLCCCCCSEVGTATSHICTGSVGRLCTQFVKLLDVFRLEAFLKFNVERLVAT